MIGQSITPYLDEGVKKHFVLLALPSGRVEGWFLTREEAEKHGQKLIEADHPAMMPDWPSYAPPFSMN